MPLPDPHLQVITDFQTQVAEMMEASRAALGGEEEQDARARRRAEAEARATEERAHKAAVRAQIAEERARKERLGK